MRSQQLFLRHLTRWSALVLALILAAAVTACGRSDADVQSDLQRQLAADTSTAGITATVTNGAARLSGVTQTKAQQDRALDITRSVKGVEQVESAMRIDDVVLTDAVKKAIAADPAISGVPLRIEVHEGDVKLFSDRTNADERAKLAQVVGAVYGVTHVEDNMK